MVSSLFRFDGIVLVTENQDTLPPELECLKTPLQDYSAVSHLHVSKIHNQVLLIYAFLSLARWTVVWERMWWS